VQLGGQSCVLTSRLWGVTDTRHTLAWKRGKRGGSDTKVSDTGVSGTNVGGTNVRCTNVVRTLIIIPYGEVAVIMDVSIAKRELWAADYVAMACMNVAYV
jgi:hypothetical protein